MFAIWFPPIGKCNKTNDLEVRHDVMITFCVETVSEQQRKSMFPKCFVVSKT